ncbi:MAG: hypothetical protein A4E62_01813 [Syntrophorhabdus sp. PtaU1.Bin002]|nr:MAG: hypothetical protein A4E62_01813 [Syntrophorhabdus sp. PtaU1.Bin002]
MYLYLKSHACDPDRVFDPILVIDDKFLGDHMDQFPVGRDRHCLCRIDGPCYIIKPHFFIPYGNHTITVETLDVGTGNTDKAGVDFYACHQLRLFHGLFYRIDGAVHIDHNALP